MAEREMKRDGREDNGEYSHRLLGERKGNGKRLEALGKNVLFAPHEATSSEAVFTSSYKIRGRY